MTMRHSHRRVVVVVGAGDEVVVVEDKDVFGVTVLVHVSERGEGAEAVHGEYDSSEVAREHLFFEKNFLQVLINI